MLDKTKQTANKLESKGDGFLTVALILAACFIVFIALSNHNVVLKAIVLAYVILP